MLLKKIMLCVLGSTFFSEAKEPVVWLTISVPLTSNGKKIESTLDRLITMIERHGLTIEKEENIFIDVAYLKNVPVSKIDQVKTLVDSIVHGAEKTFTFSLIPCLSLSGPKKDTLRVNVQWGKALFSVLDRLGRALKQQGIDARIFSKNPSATIGTLTIKNLSTVDIVSIPRIYEKINHELTNPLFNAQVLTMPPVVIAQRQAHGKVIV